MSRYVRHNFHSRSGWLVHPRDPAVGHDLLAIGHTASVRPWADPCVHLHQGSEECYLLLQGELQLLVADLLLSLRPHEILLVRPGVPHAVVGGAGPIEHFGLRAPGRADKRVAGGIPSPLPAPLQEQERELWAEWGCRVPVEDPQNRNCWLIGAGVARFPSPFLIFAFLDFPTSEAANAGIGTRHRPHLHHRSWEYYGVLQGRKRLQIEGEQVHVAAGELLAVPPGVCHALQGRQAPFVGFTLRVPVILDDKVAC